MNEEFNSNNIGNNSSNNRMDIELHVRLMNLVMGEASDFERDQLQTLMEERTDVAVYYQHLENLHGLLCEVGTGEPLLDATASDKDSSWRLSKDRRDQLLAVLDGKVQDPSPKVELASSSSTKPKLFWSRAWVAAFATTAAGLLIVLMMLPRAQYGSKTSLFLDEPDSMTAYRRMDTQLPNTRFLKSGSLRVPPITPVPPSAPDTFSYIPPGNAGDGVTASQGENATNEDLGQTGLFFDKRLADPIDSGTQSSKKDPNVENHGNGGMGGFGDASQVPETFSKPGIRSKTRHLSAHIDLPSTDISAWDDSRNTVERQSENVLAELAQEQSEERGKQQSQTTVNVPDGGTIMLGGIHRKQSASGLNQSSPELGRLFKNDAIGLDTNSLMMTVTPRIIIPEEEETLRKFSNEPPVSYPDAKKWEELANRRQNRFRDTTTQEEATRLYRKDRLADALETKPGLRNAIDKKSESSSKWFDGESVKRLLQNPRMPVEMKHQAEMRGRNVVPPPSLERAAATPTKRELAESKQEPSRTEERYSIDEQSATKNPFSTFSLHVSDVSFKLAQTALNQGQWPEAAKIRIEEFVNALDYRDPLPNGNERVACRAEQAIHPFLMQRNLLRVSMRTAATGRTQNTPLRLTILLDNSGSMERPDRRQAVLQGFRSLSTQLNAADQVTLISFASTPRLLADKVPGSQGESLLQQIENLPSEGGTNIEAALLLAREKAMEQKLSGAQNRIVLLTDGAVNLGDADPESLAKLVTQLRDSGIAFDAAGISAQDLNDEVLETLTRQGDGRYYLLDSAESANESFASQIAGSLRPSAQNVKVQMEFNPQRVGQYKLLGFEKHRLNQEDFRNDKVDAAEMAAAEAGVAVYQFEIKPNGTGDVGNVSVRFRDLSTGQMIENRWPIPFESNTPRLEQSEPSMQLAACSALLAAKLAGGPLADSVDLVPLQKILADLPEQAANQPRVQQLQTMVDQALTIGR